MVYHAGQIVQFIPTQVHAGEEEEEQTALGMIYKFYYEGDRPCYVVLLEPVAGLANMRWDERTDGISFQVKCQRVPEKRVLRVVTLGSLRPLT